MVISYLQVHENALGYWVIPEKIHTPPMDGMLEILAGGGGLRLWKSWQEEGFGPKNSSSWVIFTLIFNIFDFAKPL